MEQTTRYLLRLENKDDPDIAAMFLCCAPSPEYAMDMARKRYPDKTIGSIVKLPEVE